MQFYVSYVPMCFKKKSMLFFTYYLLKKPKILRGCLLEIDIVDEVIFQ
jgi:hypothetical protein